MKPLAAQRCFNHAPREAVARCPTCRRFFCRECISDHEGRVICARCLAGFSGLAKIESDRLGGALGVMAAFCGVLLIWIVFYLFGSALVAIPSSFHEGTLWKSLSSQKP